MSILDDFITGCTDVVPLAQGGQKTVMAARHPEYGSIVIKRGGYRYGTSLERISREVELLRELQSPYYPKHHEFIVEPVRREFLVVEERLEAVELSTVKGRFSSDTDILHLLMHLICALRVIWAKNVVHRDLKPANILITSDGEPRIIDLGIARFLDDTSLTLTIAGQGPGTPIYAAPEQLMNRKTMIGVRTDFFVLGIVVLELMHGFHPFDPQHVGNHQSLVENILSGDYVAPDRGRNSRLVGFVDGALQAQPYKRFRTVDVLMKHLAMDRQSC